MNKLTQEYLKSVMDYDPKTGIFTWLKAKGSSIIGSRAGFNCNGYEVIGINKNKYGSHRLAWLYMTGNCPVDMIDHINMNRSDNSFKNLRECNKAQNAYNSVIRCDNKSGYKGISWSKERKKWFVCIAVNMKTVPLGRFIDIKDAVKAYNKAALEYHGEFARLNIIPSQH